MRTIRLNSADQKIWFVSDIHYCHNKPFILGPRGYKEIEEAKKDFKAKWNENIGPNDIVFNLGDLIVGAGDGTRAAMYEILALPCAKHYYIWGNHSAGVQQLYDETLADQGFYPGVEVYPLTPSGYNFTFLGDRAEVVIDGLQVIIDHYPIASWNHIGKGAFMVHGHCHRNLKEDKTIKRVDVGWEWLRRPVEWHEIVRELKNRKGQAPDHHGRVENTGELAPEVFKAPLEFFDNK